MFTFMAINFSGQHFLSAITIQVLRYYQAYKLSYREIEEIFSEHYIHFHHSTLKREVVTVIPQ